MAWSLVCTAVLLAAATVAAANADADADAGEMVFEELADDELAAVEAYWTEEAMASAEPLDLSVSEEEWEAMVAADALRAWAPDDEVHTEEAVVVADGDAEEDEPSPDAAWELEFDADGRVRRANAAQRPFRYAGKLYFTRPDGKRRYCAAEFVGRRNIVLTAAGCVISGTGRWNRNKMFYRASTNGRGQKFVLPYAAVMRAYIAPPGARRDLRYDYAFLISTKKSAVGAFGLKTGIPYRAWTAIGYPWSYTRGRYMAKVSGVKGLVRGGKVEMRGNAMRMGTGGAWIGALSTSSAATRNRNYVIGLNSFRYSNKRNSMWSPYFGSTTWRLYTHVRARARARATWFAGVAGARWASPTLPLGAPWWAWLAAGAAAGAVVATALRWRRGKQDAESAYLMLPDDESTPLVLP